MRPLTSTLIITLAVLSLCHIVQSADALAETLSLAPIDCGSLSPYGSSSDLLVLFDSGVKYVVYFTFNMSEIPSGASLQSVRFKARTDAVSTPAWISAFCFPFRWTTCSWENYILWMESAGYGNRIGSKWITTNGVSYPYDFSSDNKASLDASRNTGVLTVELESSLLGVDQPSLILFSDNTKLEIGYVRDTESPLTSDIRIQPGQPTLKDDVAVEVKVTDTMSGVKGAWLHYSINDTSSWTKIPMTLKDSSVYIAVIPKQTEGTAVHYYLEAFDNANNRSQTSNYSYIVKEPDASSGFFLIVVFAIIIILAVCLSYFVLKRRTRPPKTTESKNDDRLEDNRIALRPGFSTAGPSRAVVLAFCRLEYALNA